MSVFAKFGAYAKVSVYVAQAVVSFSLQTQDRCWTQDDGSAKQQRSIYHLLCRTFSQRITISQVIYFNVFDVVTVSDVDVAVYLA